MAPGAASRPTHSSMRASAGVEEPAQLGVVGLRRYLDVRDDRGAIVQIVQHQQRVGHHHDGVGQVAVVRRRVGQRLDGAHDVVAEESDRAAGEPRQPRHHPPADGAAGAARCSSGAMSPRPRASPRRRPAGARAAAVAEHFARIGREEGVPGPALAALERLEQEAVRPRCSLAKAETGVSPSRTTCRVTGTIPPLRARAAKSTKRSVIVVPPRSKCPPSATALADCRGRDG